MKKQEFEKVYLEFPEEYLLEKEEKEETEPFELDRDLDEEKFYTMTQMSMDELKSRLEQTQSLHL